MKMESSIFQMCVQHCANVRISRPASCPWAHLNLATCIHLCSWCQACRLCSFFIKQLVRLNKIVHFFKTHIPPQQRTHTQRDDNQNLCSPLTTVEHVLLAHLCRRKDHQSSRPHFTPHLWLMIGTNLGISSISRGKYHEFMVKNTL